MTQIIGRGIQIFNGTGGSGGGGGVVAAANGLSIENRAGVLTVVWGGTVLDEPVTTDLLGFEISFIDSPSGSIFVTAGDHLGYIVTDGFNSSQFTLLPTQNSLFVNDVDGDTAGIFNITGGGVTTAFFEYINAANLQKTIVVGNGAAGISVNDTVDNVGLVGDALFPENGDPSQYAQYGNLNVNPTQKFLVDAVNGTGNIFSINTPETGETQYFFNFAAFSDTFSAGAVTQINLDYTDRVGNPQTIQLVNTITGDPESIVYSFIAAPNTSATLSYSVTDTGGGNTLTVSGQIEQQQNFT